MNPATLKTLLTFVAILVGALMMVPQLAPYQAALSAFSAGLLGWIHGRRPGDMTEDQAVAAVSKRIEADK